MLKGLPGTGKTLLATTLAEVLGHRHFFHPTIAELKHPQLGKSVQLVAELWKQVRANKPAVLFLDECESLFGKGGAAKTDAVAKKMVQTFLSQWDGKEEGVWLIAATNRREMIDDAILSRFGSEMEICLPEEQARMEILEKELAALQVHGEGPADIRACTVGMSGRDLASINSTFLQPLGKVVDADDQRFAMTIGLAQGRLDHVQALLNFLERTSDDVLQSAHDELKSIGSSKECNRKQRP